VSAENSFRLALATCEAMPGFYPDDAHLVASLRALGIEPVSCAWSDPTVDWSRFDAVLIRTTWDYFQRPVEFARWLDALPVPTINPAPLLRWNSDKRYLLELEARGVDGIPSRVCTGAALPATLAGLQGRDVVVKPTISGGAWLTVRGTVGDAGFDAELARLPGGLEYLVQPFVPEVAAAGEWSLLFFGGQFSHAVLKRAKPGDYRVQSQYGGTVDTLEPDPALLAAARRALDAVAALGHGDHAYARIDGVVVDGRFLVMELEMIEPALFLAGRPDAAERFARILLARLREATVADSA
jgi:glutathione synthase/RimK-type ligase-like ATP-grasp enzyme